MKKQLLLFILLWGATQAFAYQSVDANTFEQTMAEGNVQIVDVRTPSEFDMGHVIDAINIDYKSKKFKSLCKSQLDKTRPVLIYCTSGKRSKMAAEILEGMGFTTIFELGGGIIEWVGAGKEVTLPLEFED